VERHQLDGRSHTARRREAALRKRLPSVATECFLRGFLTLGWDALYSKYPLMTPCWEPHSRDSTSDSKPVSLDAILAGRMTPTFAPARSIVAFGKRILLRYGHEMNGDWRAFGRSGTG
jgi:hypothetical protein